MNQVGVLADSCLLTHTWRFSACAEAPSLPRGRGCRWVCAGRPPRRAWVGTASREAGPAAGEEGSPLDFSGGSTTLTGPRRLEPHLPSPSAGVDTCGSWRHRAPEVRAFPGTAGRSVAATAAQGSWRLPGRLLLLGGGPCGRGHCYHEKWGVCGLSTEPPGEGQVLTWAACPWPWFSVLSVQKAQGFFLAEGVS